jgi:predicted nuclease of restriction endonuclease-like RecB superfamily
VRQRGGMPLLPQALLCASAHVEGERIVPHYLTAKDEPWLGSLIDECARFVGRKRSELYERLREPLPVRAPKSKLCIAMSILDGLCRERAASAVPPKEARAALFREASLRHAPRVALIARVAESFGVTALDLERALFADLRGERRISELAKGVCPSRLAADANLAIASSLVGCATQVRIAASGNSHALARHSRRLGLICSLSEHASRDDAADRLVLVLAGPLALDRHARVYGRALASLVPRLPLCADYELSASCRLARQTELATFVLRSGDPIGEGRELARHESRLEQRFERDFRRAAPSWDVRHDPRAVALGSSLFADFELTQRENEQRRWLLEIVGFWTQRQLTEKLARLHAAGVERFVLCIDQNRQCAEGDPPRDARIIRYDRRIEPRAVLAIING